MRYLIIGNGPGGNAAAEAIRRRDPQSEVALLSDESHPSYYRPLLPLLIKGEVGMPEMLRDSLHSPQGVTVHLNRAVKEIAPSRKAVVLANGQEMGYDRLLLAMGSSASLPPITHLQGEGVHVLRKLDDAQSILSQARQAKKAVVIGGGRIGVKSALALRSLGLAVTIVEMLDHLIPLQLDQAAAAIVRRWVEKEGVKLLLGETVREVGRERAGSAVDRLLGRDKAGPVKGVVTGSDKRLEADMIVVAVGVRANTQLAASAGLKVRNGVLVDDLLRTSDPNIYAAGDVVETVDLTTGQPMVSGTWTNAVAMGHAAGENMAGGKQSFPGALNVYNAMEVGGLPVISAGVVTADGSYESYISGSGDNYRKLVFGANRLLGLLLIGEAVVGAGVYAALLREQRDISKIKDQLIAGTLGYARFITPPTLVRESYRSTWVP